MTSNSQTLFNRFVTVRATVNRNSVINPAPRAILIRVNVNNVTINVFFSFLPFIHPLLAIKTNCLLHISIAEMNVLIQFISHIFFLKFCFIMSVIAVRWRTFATSIIIPFDRTRDGWLCEINIGLTNHLETHYREAKQCEEIWNWQANAIHTLSHVSLIDASAVAIHFIF